MIDYSLVRDAYFDCRKHKRTKTSAQEYELEYEMNNYHLWKELESGTYSISPSTCFCVEKPKIREVFAAQFRDRIIHHLLMNRTLKYFESEFIDDTYSCRKGKGVYYGVDRIQEKIKAIGKDCWFVKLDLEGFFMSIDRDILWNLTENMLREKWTGEDDIEWWLGLFRLVIFNRCEQDCIKHGNLGLWDLLPQKKSLFYSNGRGLPIGNLTSQVLANFYLTGIDKFISPKIAGYGRYVDDMILLDTDKKKLLKLIPEIRKELGKLGLKLNEKKTIIQRADKGVPFTGYIIKPWGIYPGKRLVDGAFNLALYGGTDGNIERHVQRLNSYLGFLIHTQSYSIRWRIWNVTWNRFPDKNLWTDGKVKYIRKGQTTKDY